MREGEREREREREGRREEREEESGRDRNGERNISNINTNKVKERYNRKVSLRQRKRGR